MASSFPDLNWAKQTLFQNGQAEVLDSDGNTFEFDTHEQSNNWLLEDEFVSYEKLDSEDEVDYGITLSQISPPTSECYYVKNT